MPSKSERVPFYNESSQFFVVKRFDPIAGVWARDKVCLNFTEVQKLLDSYRRRGILVDDSCIRIIQRTESRWMVDQLNGSGWENYTHVNTPPEESGLYHVLDKAWIHALRRYNHVSKLWEHGNFGAVVYYRKWE